MLQPQKLIEVAMPITEISAYNLRENSITSLAKLQATYVVDRKIFTGLSQGYV
jgi:hypothetical protein